MKNLTGVIVLVLSVLSPNSQAQLFNFNKTKKTVKAAEEIKIGHETHGGDLVFCHDDPKVSKLKGFHNFDYLQTYKQSNENADVERRSSWLGTDGYANRLLEILKEKHPQMYTKFLRFIELRDNEDDPSLEQMWEESSFGLEVVSSFDLDDPEQAKKYQGRYKRLPLNCYEDYDPNITYDSTNLPTKIKIHRAITKITSSTGNLITYSYDPHLLSKIETAESESFLMTHEFLRLFTENEIFIRKANRLLHLKRISEPDYDLKSALENIEIKVGVPTQEEVLTHLFAYGDLVPSLGKNENNRLLAIEKARKKCEQIRSSIIKSQGSYLSYISDCNVDFADVNETILIHKGEHVSKPGFSPYSNTYRKIYFVNYALEHAIPDLEEYFQLLGYRATIKLDYQYAKPEGLRKELLSRTFKVTSIVNLLDSNSINLALVDHQAKVDHFCKLKEESLRQSLGNRIFFFHCFKVVQHMDSKQIGYKINPQQMLETKVNIEMLILPQE